MKKISHIVILSLLLVAASSCMREPIYYATGNYYLSVRLDPKAENQAALASTYAANFYDSESGKLAYSTFFRPDLHPQGMPTGGYVIGLEPGDYYVLIYDLGTAITDVQETEYWSRVYATASIAGRVNDTPVLKNPDALYYYAGHVSVPYVTEEDGVYTIEAPLKDMVQHWNVTVSGIRNADIAESIYFYISGQERGRYCGLGTPIGERAVILFSGWPSEATKAEDGLVLGQYGSFGVNASADRYLLTAMVTGPNGSSYYGQADVSDQVREAMASGVYEIKAEIEMEVEPREQGGFNPKAEPWDPKTEIIVLE